MSLLAASGIRLLGRAPCARGLTFAARPLFKPSSFRSFTTSSLVRYAKATRQAQIKPSSSAPPNTHAPLPPRQYDTSKFSPGSPLARLAAIPPPRLLFQSTSFGGFAAASYIASTCLISWAAWYFTYYYLYPPAGLPWWTPPLYGFSALVMLGMGIWVLGAPQRVIRSIYVVPSKTTPKLRITTYRSVVHLRPKTIEVPVSDITIRAPMYTLEHDRAVYTEQARERARVQELERQESVIIRPMLAFVRLLSYLGRRMLRHGRNYWNRSDFVMLSIKDHGDWKLNWVESKIAHDQKGNLLQPVLRVQYK